MEVEGDEGMLMETEEESGTAPMLAQQSLAFTESSSAGTIPPKSSSQTTVADEAAVQDLLMDDEDVILDHDSNRGGRYRGTVYERLAAGAFDLIDPSAPEAAGGTGGGATSFSGGTAALDAIVASLPYLVRIALQDPRTHATLLQRLHVLDQLNSVLAYMALDMKAIEESLANELQRKKKLGSLNPSEGSLVAESGEELISQFENGGEELRMKLFLSELHNVINHIRLHRGLKSEDAPKNYVRYDSEILGDDVYAEELGFMLPIAMFHIPMNLQTIIEALLCVDMGGRLIQALFFNFPSFRDKILLGLIQCHAGAADRVSEILFDLSSLSRAVALFVRHKIVSRSIMPGLALKLTLVHIKDEVVFMNSVLNSDYKWIAAYINEQSAIPNSPVIMIRARLLTKMTEYEALLSVNDELPLHMRIKLTSLLKLYCGFIGLFKLKLDSKEINAILSILLKVKDERMAKLGLCWILTCEGLLRHYAKDLVLASLTAILRSGFCQEMLTLLAIHFHTNQVPAAIQLIRETLGWSVAVHMDSLNQIAALFTGDLFTEEIVAKEAVKLTIQPKLSNNDTKSVAVTCIYHLLKNRIFSKHKLDVSDWIWEQITNADEPVHYLLPALIEEWVLSILAPTASYHMKRPTEKQIKALFFSTQKLSPKEREYMDIAESRSIASSVSKPVEDLTSSERASQILALYFALYYNEEVQRYRPESRIQSLKTSKGNSLNAQVLSSDLIESLPIKALLSYARERAEDNYEYIYPLLLNLVISQFPGLLTVINTLNEEELKNSTIKEFLNIPLFNFVDADMQPRDENSTEPLPIEKPGSPSPDVVRTAFENVLTMPLRTIFMLMQLSRLPASKLQAYMDLLIYTLLPLLLEEDVQHRIRVQFLELWQKLHILTPFESALKSINAISFAPSESSDHPSSRKETVHYGHMDVVMDPLIIFRCDSRLFRLPPLFKMLLQILDTYITESHKYISGLNSAEPGGGSKQEEYNSLILAQDCAIIQLLLEVCVDRDKSSIRGPLEEVQIQTCTFIHQMFCENPQLMKLVHLQGYPDELLPVTVYGIPSIHIALDFLPELLNQPLIERQIFAVKLAGHLIEKYTLPKCIDLARIVIQKMHSTMVSSDEPSTFLMETLPSLAKIATTFPAHLTDDTINFLLEATAIAERGVGMAVTTALLQAQIQATFSALAKRATDPTA